MRRCARAEIGSRLFRARGADGGGVQALAHRHSHTAAAALVFSTPRSAPHVQTLRTEIPAATGLPGREHARWREAQRTLTADERRILKRPHVCRLPNGDDDGLFKTEHR
jgi:hypothetical protein